jgi:histone H3/H4
MGAASVMAPDGQRFRRTLRLCGRLPRATRGMTLPTKELIDWWRPKLRALDPWRMVHLEEVHELYAEREGAPYRSLARDLLVAERPAEVKVLLCGARGSGKTTELTRLAHDVKQHFCVVQTDLGMGLPDEASTLAVVTLLGVAALHAIKSWSDPDAEATALAKAGTGPVGRGVERLQAALRRFGDGIPSIAQLVDGVAGIVTLFEPTIAATLSTASSVAKATGAATNAITKLRIDLARGPLEGRLKPDQRDDAQVVVGAVNEILAELETLAGRPPLLLADGLDKRTRLDEVALALDDEYLLRDLQAPLVLTGPVNLRHDPRFRAVPGNFRLALLYNVPIWHRNEGGDVRTAPEGIGVLRDLFQRRREEAEIPEGLVDDRLVERAAQSCAGIVRDFLGLLHEAGKNALSDGRRAIDADDLEAAIKARRLEMEGYLDEHEIGILHRVLAKGTLPGSAESDTLLFENFIACYHNGDIWFRPHEIIVDFIAAQQAEP